MSSQDVTVDVVSALLRAIKVGSKPPHPGTGAGAVAMAKLQAQDTDTAGLHPWMPHDISFGQFWIVGLCAKDKSEGPEQG